MKPKTEDKSKKFMKEMKKLLEKYKASAVIYIEDMGSLDMVGDKVAKLNIYDHIETMKMCDKIKKAELAKSWYLNDNTKKSETKKETRGYVG